MEIKAVRMFDHGFMNQAFAFGGEEGKDKFDEQIIYRSSLQNFIIDTGRVCFIVDVDGKLFSAPSADARLLRLNLHTPPARFWASFHIQAIHIVL